MNMNGLTNRFNPCADNRPTIMVVDDEPEIRDSFSVILEDRYNLTMAESGEEALWALQNRNDIRLVFLDYQLPGMSGLDVLKVLRKKGIHTPVVMVTGRGTRDTATEALRFKIKDYITKPFRVSEIEDTVIKILEEKETHRSPVARAKEVIRESMYRSLSTQHIAHISGTRYRDLLRQFKEETGTTIAGFVNEKRITLAKKYLRETEWTISHIAITVGFRRQNYFSVVFKKIVGMKPSDYRKKYG